MTHTQVTLLDLIGWPKIQRIRVLRKNIRKMFKTNRICKIISTAVKKEFGYPIVIGSRNGREHWWNILPCGTILDCSADQYGDDTIITADPNDPRYIKESP